MNVKKHVFSDGFLLRIETDLNNPSVTYEQMAVSFDIPKRTIRSIVGKFFTREVVYSITERAKSSRISPRAVLVDNIALGGMQRDLNAALITHVNMAAKYGMSARRYRTVLKRYFKREVTYKRKMVL